MEKDVQVCCLPCFDLGLTVPMYRFIPSNACVYCIVNILFLSLPLHAGQYSPESVPGPVCFLAPSELPTRSGLPGPSVSGQHVPSKRPGRSVSGRRAHLDLLGPLVSGQRALATQVTQNSCTEVISIDDEGDEADLIIITDSESS